MFERALALIIFLIVAIIYCVTRPNKKSYETKRLDFETQKLNIKNKSLVARIKRFINQFS